MSQEAPGRGRIAIVIREIAQSRPSSSVRSTSQTQVVLPVCRLRATALTWPSVTGRSIDVSLACPTAICPESQTAAAVALEQMLSAKTQ